MSVLLALDIQLTPATKSRVHIGKDRIVRALENYNCKKLSLR